MIDLTTLRRLHEAATEGPWVAVTVRTSCGVCHKVGPFPHPWRNGHESYACLYDDYPPTGDGLPVMQANAALIELAPDLAAAVLAHPAALREAMIRGYEIGLEEAYRNGIGLPRADKCAALLDILTEYPDAH